MWYLGDGAVAAADLVLSERVDAGLVAAALTQLGTIGRTERHLVPVFSHKTKSVRRS